MENNQNNNTNDFMPTKELGDLAKYAAEYAFGALKMWASIEKFTGFDDLTIDEIFKGTWMIKSDYIRLLSLCISRIRPKKVKLNRLPVTLPNREVMKSLEIGSEENLFLYKKAIIVLCRMPNVQPKMHKTKTPKRYRIVLTKGEDFRTSSIYRQISAQNSSIYNNGSCSSDFEYGLTDT